MYMLVQFLLVLPKLHATVISFYSFENFTYIITMGQIIGTFLFLLYFFFLYFFLAVVALVLEKATIIPSAESRCIFFYFTQAL